MVEIFNGTSTYCIFDNSINVTGTTITVKFITKQQFISTASGFFAVVTGDATVTTDVTG